MRCFILKKKSKKKMEEIINIPRIDNALLVDNQLVLVQYDNAKIQHTVYVFEYLFGKWQSVNTLFFPEQVIVHDVALSSEFLAAYVFIDEEPPTFFAGEIVIRSTFDATLYRKLEGTAKTTALIFNRDGSQLIACVNHHLKIYCVYTATCVVDVGPYNKIVCFQLQPETNNFFAFTHGGHLLLLDDFGELLHETDTGLSFASTAVINGSSVYIMDQFSNLQRRELGKPEQIVWGRKLNFSFVSMSVSRQGDKLALVKDLSNHAHVYCTETGVLLKSMIGLLDSPIWSFFTFDGRTLVTGSLEMSTTALELYPVQKRQVLSFFSGADVEDVEVAPYIIKFVKRALFKYF